MIQSTPHTISPSLDHSLTLQQAVTQRSAWAAMSISLVDGLSGQTTDKEAAISMVRSGAVGHSKGPFLLYVPYFKVIYINDAHS